MHNGIKLISGRVPTTNAFSVTSDRYEFIDLTSVEPNLGVPGDIHANNQYVLMFDMNPLTGFRKWSNLSSIVPPPQSNIINLQRVIYTANEGQTEFETPTYEPGANQVSLYIDGVKQYFTEFLESTPTSITLTQGATQNDIVLIEIASSGVYTFREANSNNSIIINDNISSNIHYPLTSVNTAGVLMYVYTASDSYFFVPNTGTLSAKIFSGSGEQLTNINASNLTSGFVNPSVLGTGVANDITYLAGDGSWKTITISNAEHSNTSNHSLTSDFASNASFANNAIHSTISDTSNSVNHIITFIDNGLGNNSYATFNGSSSINVSYNTIGASPVNGSSFLIQTGNVTSGIWYSSIGNVSGANLTNLNANNLIGTIPDIVLGNSIIYIANTSIPLNRKANQLSIDGLVLNNPTINGFTGNTAIIDIGDGQIYKDTFGNIGINTKDTADYTVHINGTFAAVQKSFVITHPTKPGYKLIYGSLEGPENGVYIRGRSENSVIYLPDYWPELVDMNTISVNLTPIGDSATPRVSHIIDNTIVIFSKEQGDLNYYFTVYGERKDIDKLAVEVPRTVLY